MLSATRQYLVSLLNAASVPSGSIFYQWALRVSLAVADTIGPPGPPGPPGTPGIPGTPGVPGAAGQNAFTTVTANSAAPLAGFFVDLDVVDSGWMVNGQVVYVDGVGYYQVVLELSSTQVRLQNLGYPSNAPAGTPIGAGAQVAPAGIQGDTGAAGGNAFTTLTAPFNAPTPITTTITAQFGTTAWMGVDQVVYIESAGYYRIVSVDSAVQATILNLGYAGNATAGTWIFSPAKVSPGGVEGAPGPTSAAVYGSFSDDTSQAIPAESSGSPRLVTFNTTEAASGVSVVDPGTGPTRLTVSQTGVYALSISPQLLHTGGGTETVLFWLLINGLPVPRSGSSLELGNNNNRALPYLDLVTPLNAGDYVEWAFAATTGTDITLAPFPSSGIVPAIPSVIASVVRIGS